MNRRSQQKPSNGADGVANNKFWNFVPGTEEAPPELILYGAISSSQSWWQDVVTPLTFNQELDALGDVNEIVVRINSGGGDVFAANAIYTRLKDHKASITVKIDGWAASAATIIAMAADKLLIARNGVFMIHDPAMTVWDTYTAEEFEKMAQELKVIKQSIINSYAMRTGLDEKVISDLMSEETWWTGDDAVTNGFCDELMFEEAKTQVENASKIIVNSVALDVSGYKTLPKQLLNSPKNPGSFSNNIKGSKPEKKEENKMAENSTITTVTALEATYPELVAAVRKEATDAERARIKGISDMAMDGFETIVNEAMFDKPVSAEAVAVQIVNEQKKQGSAFLNGREKDVENSGVNGVGAAAGEQGKDAPDVYDAAIDKLFPNKK
jgi:ATP-dependent protease ClpP protease subunit